MYAHTIQSYGFAKQKIPGRVSVPDWRGMRGGALQDGGLGRFSCPLLRRQVTLPGTLSIFLSEKLGSVPPFRNKR
jgi:hypothetical protein